MWGQVGTFESRWVSDEGPFGTKLPSTYPRRESGGNLHRRGVHQEKTRFM